MRHEHQVESGKPKMKVVTCLQWFPMCLPLCFKGVARPNGPWHRMAGGHGVPKTLLAVEFRQDAKAVLMNLRTHIKSTFQNHGAQGTCLCECASSSTAHKRLVEAQSMRHASPSPCSARQKNDILMYTLRPMMPLGCLIVKFLDGVCPELDVMLREAVKLVLDRVCSNVLLGLHYIHRWGRGSLLD